MNPVTLYSEQLFRFLVLTHNVKDTRYSERGSQCYERNNVTFEKNPHFTSASC